MTTNATTQVSIVPPSDDGKSLTPPLTSANANGGSAATATGEYQILRLKRKRNEEPLDGLLVEQALKAGEAPARGDLPIRKKKHLQNHGIFQLAETVDRREARWDDAQWRQNLQDRIVSKSQAGVLISPIKERTLSLPGVPVALSPEKSTISQRKFAVLPKKRSSYILQSPRGTNVTGIPLPGPSPLAQNGTVPQNSPPGSRPESPAAFPLQTQLQAPDVSISLATPSVPIPSPTKEVPMFEAVALSSSSGSDDSEDEKVVKSKKKGRESIKPVPVQESQDEIPDEVAAFLPMLDEYLKLHDTPANILPPAYPLSKTVPVPTGGPRPASDRPSGEDSDGGEDYVWDVYYYTSQPIALSEWANMDNYGKVSILPHSDDSSDYGSYDDSIEDEADEDSNAEEWYQNDYPEEESDPSDSDGPEDSEEDAFYDGRDDEIADDIDYDGPEWEDD